MATAQQPTPQSEQQRTGMIEITVMEDREEPEDRQRILAALAQEAAALGVEVAEARAELEALRADLATAD